MGGPELRWEDGLLVHPRHGPVAKLINVNEFKNTGDVVAIKHKNKTKKGPKKSKGKCKDCAHGWIDEGKCVGIVCGMHGHSMSCGTYYDSNCPEDICSQYEYGRWQYTKRKKGEKRKKGDSWGPF